MARTNVGGLVAETSGIRSHNKAGAFTELLLLSTLDMFLQYFLLQEAVLSL